MVVAPPFSDPTHSHLRASVIIPARDAAAYLPACLAALDRQTLPRDSFEVIVVDDGSSDDTAAVATAAEAQVVRIAHGGAAAARNAGVASARADIIVFTDADCEPAEDFIEQMLAPFAAPEVSGVRGVYRSRQREWVARFVQIEYEERYRRIAHVAERGGAMNALDTSYAAYRKSVFEQAGGFDTRFGSAAGEDHELSYRLAAQGHTFSYNPNAAVYHHHVRSFAGYARRKFRIGYWKAFLTRQHPSYALDDSHTTQSLKLQIVLAGLALGLLPLALFWPWAGWLLLMCVGLFFVSALPLLLLVARRDPAIQIVALPLVVLRSLASGAGFAWGIVKEPMADSR